MYTLYIANKNYSSWSLRPWLLMRALAIPFAEQIVTFEGTSNWDAFRKFAPNGRVPCLHDGETIVWDSLAIVEYRAERHTGVWPARAAARAWARSAACEMHSGFTELRSRCTMCAGLRVVLHEIGVGLAADIARIEELWTEGVARFGGPYLAGPALTAVDAFYAPIVLRAQTYSLQLSDAARRNADHLLGHDAMQAWYEAALAEPWREVEHEREIAATGKIVADHRR